MSVEGKIKSYLNENKISQIFICHHTGIKPAKLSLSLNGKRGLTFEEYELICGALKVSPAAFLEPRVVDAANRVLNTKVGADALSGTG